MTVAITASANQNLIAHVNGREFLNGNVSRLSNGKYRRIFGASMSRKQRTRVAVKRSLLPNQKTLAEAAPMQELNTRTT